MNEPEKSASPLANAQPKSKSRGTKWIWTVVIILLGLGWFIYRQHAGAKADGSGAYSGRGAANFPVPVVIGHARQKDVPIYLDGLGTVQAFNTVTVHTRVDGQLVKVAFTEGQDVKNGDLLAQIDPAPYQAALDQAVAK